MTNESPKQKRAPFGNIRLLTSGRYQGRYVTPDGARHTLAQTYKTRREAGAALAEVQIQIKLRTWADAKKGDVLFSDYAPLTFDLLDGQKAVRTLEGYRNSLRLYLIPTFGKMKMNAIDAMTVEKWFKKTADLGKPGVLRNAYVALCKVMSTALRHKIIQTNPCTSAQVVLPKVAERPYMSVNDFSAILSELPADLRPLVLLTFGGSLRLGEVCALVRGDLDLTTGKLRVNKQVVNARGRQLITPTKTNKGRYVAVMKPALVAVEEYLASVPKKFGSMPLFTGPKHGPIQRTYVQRHWKLACVRAGLPQYHFHDLRHASLTLHAISGGTVRESMQRAGHSTSQAAMNYQHVAEDHSALVNDRASDLMAASLG